MKLHCLSPRLIVFGVALLLVLAASAGSAVPTTISYQGRLTNADGSPVADGNYQVTFSIYDAATGGAVFWSETHPAVTVTNGLFSVLLGSVTPFGIGGTGNPTKAGEDAWLSISVDGGPESDPRIPLTSVPSAFNALRADSAEYARQAGWVDTSGYAIRANWSDSADYAFGSGWSDTSGWAIGSMWTDTAGHAFSSGWTDTAGHAISVADGSIGNASIAEGAVGSTAIADGSIALSDIGTNGATNGKIMKWNIASNGWIIADDMVGTGIISVLPGSGLSGGGSTPVVTLDVAEEGIGSQHIDTGAVRNSELAINAVSGENIQPNTIDYTKIAINTITGDRIANKTIGGGDMADSTISWRQLAPNAIISSRIAPNTIDTSDIGTDGVGSDEIIDGSVGSVDLANGAVGSSQIAGGAVNSSHIAPGQVTTAHLASNSVSGSKIQINAVSSAHIQDNSITAADLATGSVDSAAIAGYAVGSSELAPDAVQSYHIASGAIIDTKLADNAVHSAKVFDGSLVAVDLADEPGVASFIASSPTYILDTLHVIGTQTINCPTAGYLLVTGAISVLANNSLYDNSELIYFLKLDGTVDAGLGTLHWEKTGLFQTQLPLHSVYAVSSGSHLVEVYAKNGRTGNVQATGVSLSLLFIPTAYGGIAVP